MTSPRTSKPAPALPAPLRGRPPLAQAERKRILDATAAVFLEKGYAHASTAEIARRAHASKQTLYAMFPAKADLFAAVVSEHTERLFSRHVEYIESGKEPRQALTEIGDMMLAMFSAPEFASLYRIVVAEAESFPDLARQLWRVCTDRGYGLLADYLRSQRIGGPAYRKPAARFIAMVLGDYILNAMLNPDQTLSQRVLRARVREAVDDFLRLYPVQPARTKE